MDSMWDVFIAYSSNDVAFASRLADALGKHLRVFIDIYCLRPGDDWDIALCAAVEDAAMQLWSSCSFPRQLNNHSSREMRFFEPWSGLARILLVQG